MSFKHTTLQNVNRSRFVEHQGVFKMFVWVTLFEGSITFQCTHLGRLGKWLATVRKPSFKSSSFHSIFFCYENYLRGSSVQAGSGHDSCLHTLASLEVRQHPRATNYLIPYYVTITMLQICYTHVARQDHLHARLPSYEGMTCVRLRNYLRKYCIQLKWLSHSNSY